MTSRIRTGIPRFSRTFSPLLKIVRDNSHAVRSESNVASENVEDRLLTLEELYAASDGRLHFFPRGPHQRRVGLRRAISGVIFHQTLGPSAVIQRK